MLNFLFDQTPLWMPLLALVLPFVLCLLMGPRLIAALTAWKAGQPIRQSHKGCLAPQHQNKAGTPTMGGLMLIGSALLTTLLVGDLLDPRLQCCLLVMLVTACLGFMDDYAKITRHNTDGVSGWFKILLQAVAALGCAFYLYAMLPDATHVFVPCYGMLDVGWFFIPLALLVIIGSSNAVNLTDGLDGLACGCMIAAALAFSLVSAGYHSLDMFLLSIISACAGFLWFNCYPARVFMGDTGSLSLGGSLGAVAVCSGQEFLLVIIGGVFVAEALSVMIQVGWFKLSRKLYGEPRRFFRMAPLHHHFEQKGWKETQVCVRFWIISAILALLGIALYYVTLILQFQLAA